MSGTSVKHENPDRNSEQSDDVQESLRLIEDLKFFLATAPANWQENQVIRRYYLNHDEGFVSCVFWNNLYFITGTDIVRCIVYKFEHFGRKIIDRKKFEEGIFSDLRNLKCGADAILEPPRSDFLEFLFKNNCLRTQKKQKVFFWFNVPHDKLMADALERDLKKEKQDQKSTTIAVSEPAKSFQYDETQSLFTQLADHMENQKKLVEELEQNTITDKSSPEYSTNSNILQANPNNDHGHDYEFLNHVTPVQYQGNSDYEDDFPLDYFDPNGQVISDDFVNLETMYQNGNNVDSIHHLNNQSLNQNNFNDENYDLVVDASFFNQPFNPVGSGTSQVAYNEEYLIEQTLPFRPAPLSQMPMSNIPPKSTKMMSATEEFFPPFQSIQHQHQQQQQSFHQPLQPQVLPLSAKYQNFPRNALTPSQVMFPPQYYDQGGQILYQQPSTQSTQLPPQQAEYQMPYNMVHHEPEYWLPYYGEPAPYMVANNSEYMQPTVVPIPPPQAVATFGPLKSISRAPYVVPTPGRKSAKSKKKKAKNSNGGISKPNSAPQPPALNPTPKASLDEVISNKSSRIIKKDEDVSDDFNGGIPTPTASNTQIEG